MKRRLRGYPRMLIIYLLSCALLCMADEPGQVLTSVRVYQQKDRVWCEVRIENATTEAIEARRTPTSLNFTEDAARAGEDNASNQHGDSTRKTELKGWGIIFRDEDRLTIRLRPNESFIRRFDITSRVGGHEGKFSVVASWGPDKNIPRARQEGPVELRAVAAPR